MADGSRKPVESIRPGDIVLAADFLNPELIPTPARVARFFVNGHKRVARLSFANGEELICTPEHRFYVVGKGWTPARELTSDDFCLSASGNLVAFASYETLAEEVAVYNFEVESFHTYFVGILDVILVHNDCPKCKGKGVVNKIICFVASSVPPIVETRACELCDGRGIWVPYSEKSKYSKVDIWVENSDGKILLKIDGENVLRKNWYKYNTDRLQKVHGKERALNLIDALKRQSSSVFLVTYYDYKGADLENFNDLWKKEPDHYERRFNFNHAEDFIEYDLRILSQPILKGYADKMKMEKYLWICPGSSCISFFYKNRVYASFEGEVWRLLPSSQSIYHGAGCYKWCAPSGRELVITYDGVLEINPERLGTFNYGTFWLYHLFDDVVPYWLNGNIP